MTCRDVQPLASGYLDGELPEEMGDRIRRHLLRCSACRDEVETLRMAVDLLRGACAPPAVSEERLRSMLERLECELEIPARLPEAPGQLVLGIGGGRPGPDRGRVSSNAPSAGRTRETTEAVTLEAVTEGVPE